MSSASCRPLLESRDKRPHLPLPNFPLILLKRQSCLRMTALTQSNTNDARVCRTGLIFGTRLGCGAIARTCSRAVNGGREEGRLSCSPIITNASGMIKGLSRRFHPTSTVQRSSLRSRQSRLTRCEGRAPELPPGVSDAAGERAGPGGHKVSEGADDGDVPCMKL